MLHVARGDQLHRKIVEPGIVTDNEEGVRLARFADDANECLRSGIIDALVIDRPRCFGKGRRGQRPGLLRPFRGRDQSEIGNEVVMHHIGADDRRFGAAAFHQPAVAIALARRGALGFGMAKQHQTAHRSNVAFRA